MRLYIVACRPSTHPMEASDWALILFGLGKSRKHGLVMISKYSQSKPTNLRFCLQSVLIRTGLSDVGYRLIVGQADKALLALHLIAAISLTGLYNLDINRRSDLHAHSFILRSRLGSFWGCLEENLTQNCSFRERRFWRTPDARFERHVDDGSQ